MHKDYKMVELAAKAAGFMVNDRAKYNCTNGVSISICENYWVVWDPINCCKDAFRLSNKLRISINHYNTVVVASVPNVARTSSAKITGEHGRDAAARRAITQLAANLVSDGYV